MVNPPLKWWYRWQVWQAAQNSRQAWIAARDDEDWTEHFNAEQHAAHNWALEGLIDED